MLKPDPITDFDTKLYSDYLGTSAEKSKSELQIKDEKEQARKAKQEKEDEAKRKLLEIQKQNEAYQKQLEAEENAAIKQA